MSAAAAPRALRIDRRLVLALASAIPSVAQADERLWLHGEVDPLPFATGGYGGQLGVRHPALGGVRLAVASFSLNVPGVVAQLGGNDGFEVRVRPSGALYVLYYLEAQGRDGFAFGSALRYLRLRYRHDDEPGEAEASELSPEAIAAFQWHPLPSGAAHGLYVQPWIGLSVTALRRGDRSVGGRAYDALPVQPFFTVNLGWELSP
jgi:hypothetical protein